MNRIIPRIGSVIVTAAVVLFALCLIMNFPFGSYLVCMFLPIGYIMMAAGLHYESGENRRVDANTGMAFAAVYAVLIFLVYFAQTTSVRSGGLSEQKKGKANHCGLPCPYLLHGALPWGGERSFSRRRAG